jgi:acetyl/propionyl-CoA carboxylase alpha subunit
MPMIFKRLLIANRGEIAIRVMRAASELQIPTVAIYSEDEAQSLHTRKADMAIALKGKGARAYLDIEQILALAEREQVDAIHPGYGFLSENAEFAETCRERGITFVGPSTQSLRLFGDKLQARALAEKCNVPLWPGTKGKTTLQQAKDFMILLGPDKSVMVKAIAGGGGRGIRPVHSMDELEEAFERCQSEAKMSFGNGDVYVEQLITHARHIEVQVVGDQSGNVSHLWERECTVQRRNQKLVEIAPSPALSGSYREQLLAAAIAMAKEARYDSLGTFEFLVDADAKVGDQSFAFMEANPRLQVEHTVTEEVTGIDLVKTQLKIAAGASLSETGVHQSVIEKPRGFAMQVRVNMEIMKKDGSTRPSGGTLSAFDVPGGPGLRVDTFGYAGYKTSHSFDSLLAKVIGYSPSSDFSEVVARTYRGLCEFNIQGVRTNIPFLQSLLQHPDFTQNKMYTRFVEDRIADLIPENSDVHQKFYFDESIQIQSQEDVKSDPNALAGATIDKNDPLAVLSHGKQDSISPTADTDARVSEDLPAGTVAVRAPMQGTIVSVEARPGDAVHKGQQILVMEAMKMEHVIVADISGIVRNMSVEIGDAVFEGHILTLLESADVQKAEEVIEEVVDLDFIRPDLAEVLERHAFGFDDARPDAVARRRKTGQRTTRENIDDLCDSGSFVEYGPVVIAAQRRRRELQDLIERTPADGMVGGIGTVNGHLFDDKAAQVIAMSYDYTVLAGTQGLQNHRKKDRLFEIAENLRLPVIFFTEGGGGRPGDTDGVGVAGLDCLAFNYFGRLSGLVPIVGINSGRCFAGNAALLGCCDLVIATRGSNIGMGGPAMIEGGGLGIFRPEDVGPMDVQVANGVVDIAVEDEAEAVEVTKRYLSYFQGEVSAWDCDDQRLLRNIIPENRLRIYDVREVISTLADTDSVLEIRQGFGPGMVTALIRVEGRSVGVVANNPSHLAGAIESDGADKAARFMQLCDAFDIPLLFLCDTPGIMVGPEVEKTALVRHAARLFVTGANLSVPFFTIVLRKSYGLGAQAMAGGSFKAPIFTISWPTGEFGGMGLEGAVKLGYRNELAAIDDPDERKALYEEMVERMYERGKAVNTASHFELDDVIDPMLSRHWISAALRSAGKAEKSKSKKRPNIDTW